MPKGQNGKIQQSLRNEGCLSSSREAAWNGCTSHLATDAVKIPMVSRGMNCLNVAAASAVALHYLCNVRTGPMAKARDLEGRRPECSSSLRAIISNSVAPSTPLQPLDGGEPLSRTGSKSDSAATALLVQKGGLRPAEVGTQSGWFLALNQASERRPLVPTRWKCYNL